MTFTTYLLRFENTDLWHFHFIVPEDVAVALKEKSQRVICTLNGSYTFQCAVLSAGSYGYFINVNQEIRKQLNLKINDEISVTLCPDNSEYGLPVPHVFEVLWQQDPEFYDIFNKLTKGKQRTFLHFIGKFKSETKQLEKLMILRHYLVQTNGKIDFKELNQAFKKGL